MGTFDFYEPAELAEFNRAVDAGQGDLDIDWEAEEQWAAEYDAEPTPRAFCDVYQPHEPHWYRALNHQDYSCPGITQQELDDLAALTEPRCEHGLSAYLCGGPQHWYDPS
jgi:hypothetical protein